MGQHVAIGGAFHVGIEVFGSEWSYGCRGVKAEMPRRADGHVYNSSISLGRTQVSRTVFSDLCQLCVEWRGSHYHVFSRNCQNFAAALSDRLGTKPLPAWITRFPRLLDAGSKASKEIRKAKNLVVVQCRTVIRK